MSGSGHRRPWARATEEAHRSKSSQPSQAMGIAASTAERYERLGTPQAMGPRHFQSKRSASMGLTRVARRAGIEQAAAETASSVAVAIPNATGSRGLT
jgi:hypothetical protein